MDSFEHMERVKLRFLEVLDSLVEKGLITEEQYEETEAVLEQIDDYTADDLEQKLQLFQQL